MNSIEIRQKFLEFFNSKGHKIVSSAPIVVKDDPTLMFTNAGMNQFKDYFLGNKTPQNNRIVNTQKCLRVSGKHNDLEQVGYDTYHHTMFEMLGNWSFGDYFKEDAIKWAWELLTGIFKIDPDRLYVTVFGNDTNPSTLVPRYGAGNNLLPDKEAKEVWEKIIPADRILEFGKDNFWEMGETGPCGPCSEIHIDLRDEQERKKFDGKSLVNKGSPFVVELWNLVFIEFDRQADGKLVPLKNKHVDTGMGFERLCMVLQGKKSNYDTDVFQPLIQFIAKACGKKYGIDEVNGIPKSEIQNSKLKTRNSKSETQNSKLEIQNCNVAMRVIADHIRAIAFSIADGQLPYRDGSGYVIRRILRRAVRFGFTFLDFKQPFIYKLVPVVTAQFKNIFPELYAQQDLIQKVIREEESSFLRTLESGLKKLEQIVTRELPRGIKEVPQGESRIDGKTAFELYDTYGFPLDLTALIAGEYGTKVDEKGFEKEMNVQKERSKSAAAIDTEDWVLVNEGDDVEFVGYEKLEATAKIIKYRKVSAGNKSQFHIVLNKTPFYAESGGQVGDTGYIEAKSERSVDPNLSRNEKIYITDTKKENELIIHIAEKLPEDVKATFKAVVDAKKRLLTQNNHSATHLLHAALRSVLGDHVQQKGSLVHPDYLRFDFSHFAKVSNKELKQIEVQVNQKIRENIALDEKRNVPLKEAKRLGAMALFGEKYGDRVRMIIFQGYSVELCGGTHVSATGEIGIFKIIAESSVAAGVRRIEAFTADKAELYINKHFDIIDNLKEQLKNPKDISKAVHTLIEENNELKKQVESYQLQQVNQLMHEFIDSIEHLDGISYIAKKVTLSSNNALRQLAFDLKRKVDDLFLVLAAEINGKPQIAVMISDGLVKKKGYHAGNIVKELSKEIKGGGGGQAFFATAGGKDLKGLDKVILKARDYV
ncbi:MAG: alanine--tRNA ligase [Bacteroidetes bacterium]|nr:alanine--tRNA ligase [Bacteroidota bacterium]